MSVVPISVVIPAHVRVEALLRTLDRVSRCEPAPAEILVHVDGAVAATLEAVARKHPQVKLLSSPANLGPGGARDLLIRAATHDWVATFDDDSFPDHDDYFARVMQDIAEHPDAAVFSSGFRPLAERRLPVRRVAVFSGCGCIFNRRWFLRIPGYVPRPVAYGFEEVDVSLQLHAIGGAILLDPQLNVLHDHPIHGPFPDAIVTGTVVNAFLFPWVRYPAVLLPLGLLQALRYALGVGLTGRWSAVRQALRAVPDALREHRRYRQPVSAWAVLSWLRLRKVDG